MPIATMQIVNGVVRFPPFEEVPLWVFAIDDVTMASQILGLRGAEPPRASHALALLVDTTTAGSACFRLYIWKDTSTAVDDSGVGATILQPLRSGAAWVTGTPYVAGAYVNNAGNEYICIVGGTSGAPAGGPSGTSTGGALVTDGTCQWQYLGPARWGRWIEIIACGSREIQ